jgi:uncharacterized protein (TIGR02145 family)
LDDDNVAGKKLKSKSGWKSNMNGTDDFGFSALPGGYYYDNYTSAGYYGKWWTATDNGASSAYIRGMPYDYDCVVESWDRKSNRNSVRCVRD